VGGRSGLDLVDATTIAAGEAAGGDGGHDLGGKVPIVGLESSSEVLILLKACVASAR
jgi:hypothetical protein